MKNTNYLKKELYELIKTDESIFDFIQESSLDGLWYWDLEHPEEEWMNPKFWSVLGYDHQEMPHKTAAWQDIIHPEDLKLATENFMKHCENPDYPYDQTVRYTHKNGSTVWIRCRGLAVRDQEGKPLRMLGAHQEITALKNNELQLHKNTSLLRNAQHVSKIGSWELDLKTNEVVWSEELYKMYGFYDPTLSLPLYPDMMKLFTTESWEILTSALALTREQGIPYELELTTIRKDGSHGWMWERGEAVFDENKNIVGLRGVAQDITERKQIEEALKKNERRLQNLTNNINESSLISVTDEKGTIIEINNLFCELSGYTKAELVGQNHRIINSGYHDKQFWLDMWKTIAKGEIWRGEIKNRAKDSSEYWVASVINPIKDHSGKIIQYISIRQDITERKKIEIEKEALTKRLNYALDASGDGIWDWTPFNGVTVFSKAWVEMLGYEVGELPFLAREWSDRLHPDDAEWVFAAINNVTQTPENGNTISHKYRFKNKVGNYLWILNKAKVVERNEKGEATRVVGTHTNITKQKEAEEEIKRTTILLEAAQKLAKMGAWKLNLKTGQTFWTDEVYSIHEVEKDFDHNKANGIEFYHPDYRPVITKAITDSIEQQISFDVKCKFITAKNNQRWVRCSGYPVNKDGQLTHLIGMFKDITQEETDKEAIFKEQMFSKQLLENMADGFLVVDTEERLVLVNKAFCKMTGFSENELIGQTAPYPFWPAEEEENIVKALQQTLAGDLNTFELTLQKKNGKRFAAQLSTSILKDVAGNTINYFANIKDITEQKKKEAEIAAISKEIKDITNAVNEATALSITNTQNLFVRVNKKLCELSGYTEEELIGQNHSILNADYHDAAFWHNQRQTIMAGKTWKGEIKKQKKDGSYYWVNAVIQPILNDSGVVEHYISIRQDITDRKNTELILHESEKKFREFFENLIDEVHLWKIVKDITGKITGWQLVDANPSALKSWGKSITDVIGKTANEIFGSDAHAQFMPIVTEIFKTYKPYHWENYFSPTDQYLYMESIPFGDYFISTGKDITKQKKSEQALKDSELRLSMATHAGGIGVFDWDIVENKLTWDDQMFALYGVKKEAFTNALDTWSEGVYQADREQAKIDLELALKDEKEFNTEFRAQHPNGEIRNVRALGTVLRDAEGNAIRMIGTNWDITKEKETLRQIEEAKEQAEYASKAKSEFLANMSHEIRTPLNGVIGFTELLTKTPLSPVQQQYADSANVSGHTLLGIINDILDFSKIEAGMLELEAIKTDMVALLENSIDIVKFTADHKALELLLDIDPSMPRFAHIDSIRTKQILANLLSNAIKFTQKGEVALKAVYQALDGKQGKLSISVRDTGIGITEEQKVKLFKSFSQADSSTTRKFGGTGLGLVISQMITEKMGSKIHIDSTPDVSTTFYFDIITDFEEGERLDTTQIKGVKRCLIIDDNDNNRLILEQMLKQWHIVSDTCNNGLEALKKLENSQPYDVVICDYDMPYFNGIETIRLMKDKLKLSIKKQPVILLHSSLDDTELNQKCKELGIRFRLNKPVKSQDLFNYLSHLDETPETNPQKETAKEANVSQTSGKIKILIAEDNPLNMVLSKTLISQLMPNSEVYEARNGLEAIEQYKNISPDLIFMDVQMPELDGMEVTKKIRASEVNKGTHLPIVALTAGALKEEKEKCLAAGMDDFLTKPLEYTKIQTVLNKFFEQGKKINPNLQNREAKNEIHFGFSELKRSMGNDMEVTQKLISLFIATIPTKIDQLKQACNEMNLANIKAIAHSIIGTTLSMRCNILAEIAGKIEKATKDNSSENLEVLLIELKEEWETVKNLLLHKTDQ